MILNPSELLSGRVSSGILDNSSWKMISLPVVSDDEGGGPFAVAVLI